MGDSGKLLCESKSIRRNPVDGPDRILKDFKLEFGRLRSDPSTVVLAGEITPDARRLWDVETGRKTDRVRRIPGDVMEAYAEVLKRVDDAAQS